jgi:hypothetical protein
VDLEGTCKLHEQMAQAPMALPSMLCSYGKFHLRGGMM